MIFINIESKELEDLLGIGEAVQKACNNAAQIASSALHAKIVELATQRLHSRKEMFIESLEMFQDSEDVWIISLKAKARWIDEGAGKFDMKPNLLKNGKRSKDGSTYKVIPFEHSKPGAKTPAQASLLDTIKQEMKKSKIPLGVEKNANGEAKLGLIHSLNIMNKPIKNFNGPGQGQGPIGAVKQGASGTAFLKNIQIYQHKDAGSGKVKKSILTFRTISSNSPGSAWQMPEQKATNIFEDAEKWFQDEFFKSIGPNIIANVMKNL